MPRVPVTKHLLNKINQKNRIFIRRALGIRPSGWRRRQPGSISLVNHKLCKFGVLRGQFGRIPWGFPAYNLSSNSGLGKMEEEKIVLWPDVAFRLAGATEFRPRVRGSVNPVAFPFPNYDLCKVGILREQFGYSP